MAARRRPAPPPFHQVAAMCDEMWHRANRITSLSWGIESLKKDDIPDADKLEMARLMLNKSLARNLTLLVGAVSRLNSLLADAPPLSEADEAWLRRQLEGLDGGRA
jgi:hypothetical protein